MRLLKLLPIIAFAVLCSMLFSASTADARPNIKFHADSVTFEQGEATVSGYFENTGDTDGYAKWIQFDLILTADNGQEMWSDYGIFHELDDIYIPAYGAIEYTFYVQSEGIPEYHGKYRWQFKNSRTHWDTSAG